MSKKKLNKEEHLFSTTIPVSKTERLYLHQEIGQGKYGDVDFGLTSIIPSGGLLIRIGEERFVVHSKDIAIAVIEGLEAARGTGDSA